MAKRGPKNVLIHKIINALKEKGSFDSIYKLTSYINSSTSSNHAAGAIAYAVKSFSKEGVLVLGEIRVNNKLSMCVSLNPNWRPPVEPDLSEPNTNKTNKPEVNPMREIETFDKHFVKLRKALIVEISAFHALALKKIEQSLQGDSNALLEAMSSLEVRLNQLECHDCKTEREALVEQKKELREASRMLDARKTALLGSSGDGQSLVCHAGKN